MAATDIGKPPTTPKSREQLAEELTNIHRIA